MQLSVYFKEMKPLAYKFYQSENHADLKKREINSVNLNAKF